MAKQFIIFILSLTLLQSINAQGLSELSLSEAYQMLENLYPALLNSTLLEGVYQNDLKQLEIDTKPSILLYGEGRLQSERIKLDGGANFPINVTQPLINVKSYVEAQYVLLDGGLYDARRQLREAQLKTDQQQFEIDKFALKSRIDVLFLNIELAREQVKLFDFSIKDLSARSEQMNVRVNQGVALESELIKLTVKDLEIQSAKMDVIQQIKGLISSLSFLIGESIAVDVELILPDLSSGNNLPSIDRPEQDLFDFQKDAITAQSIMIDVDKRPKLVAFAQAGLGYPNALNLFDTNVAPYGIVGAKMTWKLTDWDKAKHMKNNLQLQARMIDNAKATFEYNLNTRNAQYLSEVSRLEDLIANDVVIAELQNSLLIQLSAQLDEGIITSTDYVVQANAELRARQNLILHQKQLQKIQLEYLSNRGVIKQ